MYGNKWGFTYLQNCNCESFSVTTRKPPLGLPSSFLGAFLHQSHTLFFLKASLLKSVKHRSVQKVLVRSPSFLMVNSPLPGLLHHSHLGGTPAPSLALSPASGVSTTSSSSSLSSSDPAIMAKNHDDGPLVKLYTLQPPGASSASAHPYFLQSILVWGDLHAYSVQ